MENAPVRFALIGFGAFGRRHADAIAAVDGAELAAIAERSEAGRAEAAHAYPKISVYERYEALLETEKPDVVDVVVPNHLHAEVGQAALAHGAHVLIEKPMTLTAAEAHALIAQAERAERTITVGHEFRLSPLWGGVKRLIADGAIGEPRYVLVELSRGPYRHGADGWRYDTARVGNWILEEPIHFFDLARWYLADAGEPESVYALASARQPDRPDLHDNLSALIRHGGGAYAVVSQTLGAYGHHQTVKVTGTTGALFANWGGTMGGGLDPGYHLRYFDGEALHDADIAQPTEELPELRAQIAGVAARARGQTINLPTGHDGLWAVALCEAAERSVAERAAVALQELVAPHPPC